MACLVSLAPAYPGQDGSVFHRHQQWIVPIPGTTKLHRLEENLGAVNVELTAADLQEIENAASKIEVQGARYPENLQKLVGR